jgi:hypothetical protein
MNFLVIQKNKKLRAKPLILRIIGTAMIWSALGPIIMADIFLVIYQAVYFSIQGIPKIKRSQYIVLDRWDLSKLTIAQKLSCIYCGYANGIAAWAKAVVNQTEVYSCAIKHKYAAPGQEHQKEFAEYQEYL